MKKLIAISTLLLTVAGIRAALPQPDLVAQIHFAGAQKILAAPNAAAFTNEFCSAEAQALRQQTADKLAGWLAGWLQQNAGVGAGGAAKLRPLFDDLPQAEWFLEARATAGGQPQVAIIIKLDAGRAKLWQDNLKAIFPSAVVESAAGWLSFSYGADARVLAQGLLQKTSAPATVWFSADVNWPRLAQWYPKLKELGLPETQLAVTAPDENLRISGKLFLPENLTVNLEPWRVPTNTLHQPFVSVTAVRGFAGWLKSQPWLQPYQISPTPNQLFIWALPQVPYQTFAAVPLADPADALAQSYARLEPVFAAHNQAGTILASSKLVRTNNDISLTGVPFIAPSLKAIQTPAGPFLFGSLFPNTVRSKPLPAALFQRLAQKNLVLYHWEITAERLPSALNLSQLGLLLTSHRQLGGESAAMKWIQKTAPKLGNSITEIFQTGPAELTFSRKSTGIFTAAEMLTLGNWLEAPNFPGCNLALPPRTKNPMRPHPAAPGLPATIPAK